MIHAAAPHFLWPFAVQYAAHQLNLQPQVSIPETSPTLRWMGKVGDASAFRFWGSRAFVRDLSADKLSSRAVPCVFLGFPPDSPGWQFYHPTSRRVLSFQNVTFDESVPYYHAVEPVEVAVDSGTSGGAELACEEPGGAGSGGAEPEHAEPGGAGFGGAKPERAEPGGAGSWGAEPGVAESGGGEPAGAGLGGPSGALSRRELPSPQELREWFARRWSRAAGAGGTAGARGSASAGGAGATSPGGARTGGTGAAGRGGATGAGATSAAGAGGAAGVGTTGGTGAEAAESSGGPAGARAAVGAGGTGAGGAAGGTGAGGAAGAGAAVGAGVDATGAAGGPACDSGTAGVGADAAGAVSAGSGGATRPRPCFLASPLPAPSPYTGPTGGLAERREPGSRPASPVHGTASQRVPLPSPPASSLPALADPESDSLRAASPTVTRFLATAVTDPSFESATASAFVAELVDFAAHCRLDYAACLVAESASVCPPSVGGECALSTDVLEDRQEEFQCFAAALPYLVSTLLAPEGDPDAPDIPTPRSYVEAIEGPYSSQWQAAMDAEMASWKSTGTYVDEVPPPGANIVSGMWIFRVKRPPGSPPVFKARYVARGFSQWQGVDYFQTFSPTPKMTTLRVLLHVVAHRDYELHSYDFSTAFLQGSLHEEIWLRRPPGFTGSLPPGTQWSLPQPVYGLRQAPREWHDTLRTTLATLGFAPSTADPSLFLRTDTLLPPFYILITRDRARRTITLTQSHMVQQVLQRFDFMYSSPQATPLSTRHSLSALPSDESVEPSGLYPELVGCLMYLMTCTRPDLAYPLSILARYVAPGRHRPEHMAAAKRVLRYLCSTSGMGLVLGGRSPVVLTGHVDASWVDDLATQRSSQGYTFSLGSGSVSWRSTRSSSVFSSRCEAEIYAGAMAAQELRWLTYLLTDLGEPPRSPLVLTKHIALRYFLARELQQRGQLRLAYVASQANTADIFTKALQPCDHQRFCTMLGLIFPPRYFKFNSISFLNSTSHCASSRCLALSTHPTAASPPTFFGMAVCTRCSGGAAVGRLVRTNRTLLQPSICCHVASSSRSASSRISSAFSSSRSSARRGAALSSCLAASVARRPARRSTQVWSVQGGGAVFLEASADGKFGHSAEKTDTTENPDVDYPSVVEDEHALPPAQGFPDAGDSESSSSEDEALGDGSLADLIDSALAAAHVSCCAEMERLRLQPDVEAVHDLRVAVRRLRSTISVFSPFIRTPWPPLPQLPLPLLAAPPAAIPPPSLLTPVFPSAFTTSRLRRGGGPPARDGGAGRCGAYRPSSPPASPRHSPPAYTSPKARTFSRLTYRTCYRSPRVETLAAVQQRVGACGAEEALGEQRAVGRFEHAVRKQQRRLLRAALAATAGKDARHIMHALERCARGVKPLSPSAAVLLQQHVALSAPSLLTPHIAAALLDHAWSINDLVTLEVTPGAAHKQQQETTTSTSSSTSSSTNSSSNSSSSGGSDGDGDGGSGGSGGGGGGEGHTVVYRHAIMDHMHALRKLLRELRYRMDLLEVAYSPSGRFPGALQRVKRLQSILGEQQDLHVLADALLPHAHLMPATMLALRSYQLQVWEEWMDTRGTVRGLKESRALYRAVLKPTPNYTPPSPLPHNLDLSPTPSPTTSSSPSSPPHSALPDLASDPNTELSASIHETSTPSSQPTSTSLASNSTPPLSTLAAGTSLSTPVAAASSVSHPGLDAATPVDSTTAPAAPAAEAVETAPAVTETTVSGEMVEGVSPVGSRRMRRRVRAGTTTRQHDKGGEEQG
ncbi:unnamed protein product [Closterium sp. NIES-53]